MSLDAILTLSEVAQPALPLIVDCKVGVKVHGMRASVAANTASPLLHINGALLRAVLAP